MQIYRVIFEKQNYINAIKNLGVTHIFNNMADIKDFILKILEKGLLNDDGEPLPFKLIKQMPFGVANEIYTRIADVSGVKENREEQYELTKELLGF